MIAGVPVKDLTAPVLVSIFVLLIFIGQMIPRKTYKDKAEECDRWRVAFETEREARTTSDRQTSELLEGQKASHAVLVAIFTNSEKLLEARGSHDVAS